VKYDELKALSDEALVHKELSLERLLLQHQFRHRLGQLENTSVLKSTRRDIARAQTELATREATAGENKGTLRARHAGTFTPEAPSAPAESGGGFLKGLTEQPGENA
jgi:ribosomal protein L29